MASGAEADRTPALGYRYAAEYGEAAGLPAAEAELPAVSEAPQIDPAQTQRLVVYNAVVNVVVERISDSLNKIKAVIIDMGGYMQQMTSDSITLKVPADKFQDAIAEVEKLGEVTRKQITGTDVTEEMRDLNIRLKNAEEVRERLIKLLDRAEKVEDALKIEKELERITETIELLKGKIAYLQNSVAFCTLTVNFNSPIPQKDIAAGTPFRWVHELGDGLTQPVGERTHESSSFMRQSMFALPEGFIKYYEDDGRTRAMSADGVMIYMHRQRNYKGGSVDFWAALVRRVLVEQKVFSIAEQLKPKLKNKADAVVFICGKQIGSKDFGYLVGLAANKKSVYVLEAWGPIREFKNERDKLEDAVESTQTR